MSKTLLYKVGAVCAILGALVAGIANGMHPDVPRDPAAFLTTVANSTHWAGLHWALLIGLVLMQVGFLSVKLTLRDDPTPYDAGGWGRLGYHILTVGLALWAMVFTVEAALKPLADAAKADPTQAGAARTLATLGDAGITAATIVYWLGIGLIGLGIVNSSRYPRWMGLIGVTAGAIMSIGVGFCRAFGGPNRWTEEIGFPILAILTLVWTLVLGVLLWRTAEAKQRKGRR